jgi:hypothetical protein
MMTRHELGTYSASDERAFHRWMAGTAVIGSITATAFGFMALAGSGFSISLRKASADVSELASGRSAGSALEIMIKASHQLPIQSEDEQPF